MPEKSEFTPEHSYLDNPELKDVQDMIDGLLKKEVSHANSEEDAVQTKLFYLEGKYKSDPIKMSELKQLVSRNIAFLDKVANNTGGMHDEEVHLRNMLEIFDHKLYEENK